jgi:hypothetical protein
LFTPVKVRRAPSGLSPELSVTWQVTVTEVASGNVNPLLKISLESDPAAVMVNDISIRKTPD